MLLLWIWCLLLSDKSLIVSEVLLIVLKLLRWGAFLFLARRLRGTLLLTQVGLSVLYLL